MKIQFVALLIFLSPMPALAYVDPGSGFVLWQGLIAALGAALVFVRNPIRAIINWLRRFRDRK
jgi:hypothetical protein